MFGKDKQPDFSILKTNPYKFHIFGAGQCGGNVARELRSQFLDSEVSYMNTNKADIEYLSGEVWSEKKPAGNKLLLGDGGTGRSLKQGSSIVDKNIDLIKNFVASRLEYNGHDFVVIVLGLGGGTGSSFLAPLTAILAEMKKKVILLATIPEMSSALPALPNAGLILDKIQKNSKYYSNVFLISNDFVKEKAGIGGDHGYWTKVNMYIANYLMVLMNLNNLGFVSRSYGALDEKELLRVLTLGRGFGDFRVFNVSKFLLQDSELIKLVRNSSQIFLKDSRVTSTSAASIVILTPDKQDNDKYSNFIDRVFTVVPKALGNPPFILKGVFETEKLKDKVIVFFHSSE